MKKTIVWFRNDLRLHDQPALWEASEQGIVIPVYINSHEEAGEATNWWLHHSLIELQEGLQAKGLTLILKSGNAMDELKLIIDETKADAIFFNERYEPSIKKIDREIIRILTDKGLEIRTFHGNLLINPNNILNKKNEPYKIFTSFWKRFIQDTVPLPSPIPKNFYTLNHPVSSLSIDELGLLTAVHWHEKLHNYWKPGESGAIARWEEFREDGMAFYKEERDIPSKQSVSTLSPYIASGNISVKAIWHATKRQFDASSDSEAFLRQLIWREFAHHQLIHFPTIIHTPLRDQFKNFPWQGSNLQFNLWQKGQTGYPLVDAGMRELLETGAIHNRVRMVVASFLVKHLLISWTEGSAWFKDTLVDFDMANNALGWQWITGCGIDSAPYFRIFNPFIQSEKFDKDGAYIRKWIPELTNLPFKYIHKPWEAHIEVLETAEIKLGFNYPLPMVDHATARKRALAAFQETKIVDKAEL